MCPLASGTGGRLRRRQAGGVGGRSTVDDLAFETVGLRVAVAREDWPIGDIVSVPLDEWLTVTSSLSLLMPGSAPRAIHRTSHDRGPKSFNQPSHCGRRA